MKDRPLSLPWLVAVALSLILLTAARPVWAAARVELSGPASAQGDGKTRVKLKLVIDPPGAASTANLEVTTSAGKLGLLRPSGPGKYEFVFVPPSVAEAIQVSIEARLAGARRAAAKHELVIAPALGGPGEHATGGPLDLRVPKRLILGVDTHGDISLEPAEGYHVSLYASVGTVTALEPGTDGRLHATYRPPPEKFPQIAIVAAATDDGSMVDWAAVKLYGRPRVTAKSERNAAVRVRVAGEAYGPVTTDNRGKAQLRVLAPPGVNEVFTVARDAAGNETVAQLKLGVPAFQRTLAVCPRESGDLLLFVVDPTGSAPKKPAFDVKASLGKLSVPSRAKGGFFKSRLSVPDETASGEKVTFTAALSGDDASQVSCDTEVPGEAPTGLRVALDRAAYVAGTGDPIRVTVGFEYPGKRHPRRVPVQATTTFGTLSELKPSSKQRYVASWNVPDRLTNRTQAVITVRTRGTPALSAKQVLRLAPGPVAHVVVSAKRTRLWADGQSSTTVTAKVLDASGNAVPTVALEAEARGQVGQFSEKSPGVFSAAYVAPASGRGSDNIIVRDSKGSARGSVAIGLIPASSLRAWARIGYLGNFAKVSAPLVGAGAGMRLAALDKNLIAGVELGLFSSSSTDREAGDQEDVTMSLTGLPLLARLVYEFQADPLIPYVGLTGGLCFAQTKISSASAGKTVTSHTLPAIAPVAGASAPLGPGLFGLQLGYLFSPVDDDAVEGNAGGLDITLAYQYGF